MDDIYEGVTILSPADLAANAAAKPPAEPPAKPTDPPADPPAEPGVVILTAEEIAAQGNQTPSADPDDPQDLPADPPADSQDPPAEPGQQTAVQATANVLSNMGMLTVPEGTVLESEDDITALYNENIEEQADERAEAKFQGWLKALPPKAQAVVGLLEEGLDDTTSITLAESRDFVTSLGDESSEADLEKGYRLRLEGKGMSAGEVDELVQETKDLNKLKDRALTSKPLILADLDKEEAAVKQQILAQEQQQIAERTEYVQSLEKSIDNYEALVPGIKLTPQMKQKIKDSFVTPVGEVNGQQVNQVAAMRSRNPQGFDTLLHYYTQLGLFNINDKGNVKPDLKALKRKAASDATGSLLDIATQKDGPVGGGGSGGKTSSLIEKLETLPQFQTKEFKR